MTSAVDPVRLLDRLDPDAPLAERLMVFARLHPVATAGVAGLALVPERRELFGSMPVEDNLVLGGYRAMKQRVPNWMGALERVYTLDALTTGLYVAYSRSTADAIVTRSRAAFDSLKREGLPKADPSSNWPDWLLAEVKNDWPTQADAILFVSGAAVSHRWKGGRVMLSRIAGYG